MTIFGTHTETCDRASVTKNSSPLHAAILDLKSEMVHLLAFSFAINLLVLAVPIFMIQVFDRVLTSNSMETLAVLAIGTVIALLVMACLDIIRGRILIRTAHRLERGLSEKLVCAGHADRCSSVAGLRGFIGGAGMTTLLDMPWAPMFIGLIFVIHPTLGWIALGGAATLLGLAFFSERFVRKNHITSISTDRELHQFTSQISGKEKYDNFHAASEGLIRSWLSGFDQASQARLHFAERVQTSATIGRFIRMGLQICLITGAAVLIANGQLTAGGMIAASIIAARALGPFERAQEAWRSITDARVQIHRLSQLDLSVKTSKAAFPDVDSPRLDVEGIAYIPKHHSRPLFANLSLSLSAGAMLGISGASGTGKSTLGGLLAGFCKPTQGRVRFNLRDTHLRSTLDNGPAICLVSQSSQLMSGTIAENISLFSDAPFEHISKAARLTGAEDAILDLPDGYETRVGPGSKSLSAGVTQRIFLAQAICQNPKLLILDEPYTHLDNAGVTSLLTAIAELRATGCIIVIISQRPSILARCDNVMILQDGHGRFVERRGKAALKLMAGSNRKIAPNPLLEAAQ